MFLMKRWITEPNLADRHLAAMDVRTLRRQRRCDQASVSDHHYNQGDGKRFAAANEVRKTIVDHAGAVGRSGDLFLQFAAGLADLRPSSA